MLVYEQNMVSKPLGYDGLTLVSNIRYAIGYTFLWCQPFDLIESEWALILLLLVVLSNKYLQPISNANPMNIFSIFSISLFFFYYFFFLFILFNVHTFKHKYLVFSW